MLTRRGSRETEAINSKSLRAILCNAVQHSLTCRSSLLTLLQLFLRDCTLFEFTLQPKLPALCSLYSNSRKFDKGMVAWQRIIGRKRAFGNCVGNLPSSSSSRYQSGKKRISPRLRTSWIMMHVRRLRKKRHRLMMESELRHCYGFCLRSLAAYVKTWADINMRASVRCTRTKGINST